MSTDLTTDVNFLADGIPAETLLKLNSLRKNVQKHLEKFQLTLRTASPLFCAFEQLDLEVSFGLDQGFIYLSFTGTGDKLTQVWRELRNAGWKPDQRPTGPGTGGFSTFWRREDMAVIYMMFSSTVCRRVQIGTKLVEQPIYETQCGELPQLEDGSEPSALAELGV